MHAWVAILASVGRSGVGVIALPGTESSDLPGHRSLPLRPHGGLGPRRSSPLVPPSLYFSSSSIVELRPFKWPMERAGGPPRPEPAGPPDGAPTSPAPSCPSGAARNMLPWPLRRRTI